MFWLKKAKNRHTFSGVQEGRLWSGTYFFNFFIPLPCRLWGEEPLVSSLLLMCVYVCWLKKITGTRVRKRRLWGRSCFFSLLSCVVLCCAVSVLGGVLCPPFNKTSDVVRSAWWNDAYMMMFDQAFRAGTGVRELRGVGVEADSAIRTFVLIGLFWQRGSHCLRF